MEDATMNVPTPEELIENDCRSAREKLLAIEKIARIAIKQNAQARSPAGDSARAANISEQIAQVMLAVRALEEARMRFGKVLQYNGDGVSCFDK